MILKEKGLGNSLDLFEFILQNEGAISTSEEAK